MRGNANSNPSVSANPRQNSSTTPAGTQPRDFADEFCGTDKLAAVGSERCGGVVCYPAAVAAAQASLALARRVRSPGLEMS